MKTRSSLSLAMMSAVIVYGGTLGIGAEAPVTEVLPDTVWLDSETGTLKPVPVTTSNQDSVNRNSRWLPEADKVRKTARPNTPVGGATGGGSLVSQAIGWILIALIMCVVVGTVIYALKNSEAELMGSIPKGTDLRSMGQSTQQRRNELPLELQTTHGDPRGEAERLMAQGDYGRAIVMLYGHQLLMLDRHGLLRLSRGKTNNRYVRETGNVDRAIAKLLRRTVDAFERSYFGKHSIDSQTFQGLWETNASMERSVVRYREVAA